MLNCLLVTVPFLHREELRWWKVYLRVVGGAVPIELSNVELADYLVLLESRVHFEDA